MEREPVGVGLLGCGHVGAAVVRSLSELAERMRCRLMRVAVRDLHKPRACALDPSLCTDDPWLVLADPRVDVVVEVMGGLHPAWRLVRAALAAGKPVVTANKALLGSHGPELREASGHACTPLLYEGAVAAAVPVIRVITAHAAVGSFQRIEGVLNGTSNYILTRMVEHGADLPTALRDAQRLGYAEADPRRDLDGTDAADKLAVLGQLAFGDPVRTADVDITGIDEIDTGRIEEVTRHGRIWRLVAKGAPGGPYTVKPQALPIQHPLARLSGPANGVLLSTCQAGEWFLSGPGAGGEATAAAILSDLHAAALWLACRLPAGGLTRATTPLARHPEPGQEEIV